jgi:environmental stress-induced protein Ves
LSIEIQRAVDRTPQPWKNGLGVQYEIICDGSLPDDWTWRLSTADITQDVPFSVFPGVNREFCVADGNGVVLTINGVEHRCEPGSITKFRGDDVVFATLIDGPMRALNLMVRDGAAEKHLQVVGAGSSIDLAKAAAIIAITGAVKLQQNWGEVVLETLDSQLVLNSEKFVGKTLSAVVEGCVVALMY